MNMPDCGGGCAPGLLLFGTTREGRGYVEYPALYVAEIILDAATLSQAALDSDIDKARFRARLIASQAAAVLMLDVVVAATKVIDLLSDGSTATATVHTSAIEALFVAIDEASAIPQAGPSFRPSRSDGRRASHRSFRDYWWPSDGPLVCH